MWFFLSTKRSRKERRRAGQRTRSALGLEALEDRTVPSFLAPASYTVGTSPLAIAPGDFNGDAKLDFAVANQQSNTVSVLLSNSDGSFRAAQNFATGAGPQALAVGDFNADGKLDIVTANRNDLSLLRGNGDGTFQ